VSKIAEIADRDTGGPCPLRRRVSWITSVWAPVVRSLVRGAAVSRQERDSCSRGRLERPSSKSIRPSSPSTKVLPRGRRRMQQNSMELHGFFEPRDCPGRKSQDLRLILFATSRAQNQSNYCPRVVGQHDSARQVREPGRNVRVWMGFAEIDPETRPRLAASQRCDQIELAINLDICQGAWLGGVPRFLLGAIE
jgi:hypothetical protein